MGRWLCSFQGVRNIEKTCTQIVGLELVLVANSDSFCIFRLSGPIPFRLQSKRASRNDVMNDNLLVGDDNAIHHQW